jgi:Cys-tRNA(Pro) deacylase
MAHVEIPVTPAVRLLRERGIPFDPLLYAYEDHGGAPRAAAELGVSLHAVVKTLVMETDERKPLLVLMHGDLEVSTKRLARALGVKRVAPCDPAAAQKHTGYMVGGISPLGTRVRMPVYAERSVLDLDRIYLNGGKRGFLVALSPTDLARIIPLTPVCVALPPG